MIYILAHDPILIILDLNMQICQRLSRNFVNKHAWITEFDPIRYANVSGIILHVLMLLSVI